MPKKTRKPTGASAPTRKRRTREHIIADLSVNFVERLILESGFTGMRHFHDYGYDVTVETFDSAGYPEEGRLFLQLKATDTIHTYERVSEDCFSFPVDQRDRHLWISEPYPVFLILYDATCREAYWQHVQAYFADHPPPDRSLKSVQVRIPRRHLVGCRTIQMMRDRKNQVLQRLQEVLSHD